MLFHKKQSSTFAGCSICSNIFRSEFPVCYLSSPPPAFQVWLTISVIHGVSDSRRTQRERPRIPLRSPNTPDKISWRWICSHLLTIVCIENIHTRVQFPAYLPKSEIQSKQFAVTAIGSALWYKDTLLLTLMSEISRPGRGPTNNPFPLYYNNEVSSTTEEANVSGRIDNATATEQNESNPSCQDIDEFRLIWEYLQYWQPPAGPAHPGCVCMCSYANSTCVFANQVCSSLMSAHWFRVNCRTICHVPFWDS